MSNVLSDRDVNAPMQEIKVTDGKVDVKSMEYHRQVLKSKLDEQQGQQQYISPSDNIMSPCTAKLSAYRNKQVGKAKPKSLFAKASANKLASGGGLFGARNLQTNSPPKQDSEDSNMD
jgi:hypothetical protein